MNELQGWRLWAVISVAIIAAVLPAVVRNDYLVQIFFRIALFAALGLAWNLVGGYAGQLSLGHVAFFGIGAYGLAIFTERGIPRASLAWVRWIPASWLDRFTEHGFPIWISLLLAALLATLAAALIGKIVFRLRGPYFTLATIAFAEILRLTATNLEITKGALGLNPPALFSGRYIWVLSYYSVLTLAIITFLVNAWTARSRFGYYLMAIREDEDTASAVGIDTANYKLRALMLSAFLTALGGALFASAWGFIIPDNVFTIDVSVQIAIVTMLGGAGTLVGPIVGAVLLLSANELFKNQFEKSHLLIYGILIVLVVLFLPEGLVGGLEHRLRGRLKPPRQFAGPAQTSAADATKDSRKTPGSLNSPAQGGS